MISNTDNRKVRILITTYQNKKSNTVHHNIMDNVYSNRHLKNKKVICSLCLSSNNKLEKKISRACPLCQKSCDYCKNNKKERDKTSSDKHTIIIDEENPNSKSVQTYEADVAQGLNLLNEVLTVFQNKKVDINKGKSKTGILKDVGVSTDKITLKPYLTVSTFQYSIDEIKRPVNSKFTVLNSCQPAFLKKSQYSIDLIKHKSSSIPQMKIEELKYSLKEKTKSKDAIEEVNRLFATVRKHTHNTEYTNRPLVRNGPRILPVVKNNHTAITKIEEFDCGSCKCCQTKHCMSSGDSFIKPESHQDKDEKSLYMVCCHYKNHHTTHTGATVCERCKRNEYCCVHGLLNGDDSG